MADVVNLNQFRKKRRRDEKAKKAVENRVRHGRTKTEEKIAEKQEADRVRTLDGKKREQPEDC